MKQTTISLSNGTIANPYDLPPNGVRNASQDQLRDTCCHRVNMIQDIDKAVVSCAGYHCEPNDVV